MYNELCGCGRPVRYAQFSPLGGTVGSCNKYGRCPSYEELEERNKTLHRKLREAYEVAEDLSLFRESTGSYNDALKRLKVIEDYLKGGC